jgi:stage II sporulation protein D
MHESWPLEALKAQAVAARTYAARKQGGYGQYGFDVTGTASSQAYGGTAAVGPNITAAVEATAGLYLTYGGTLCEALYFSSSGGGTEDSENVFPNALPYLRGVLDPYEKAANDINGSRSWTRSWTRDSIRSKITALGYSFGTLAEILPTYSDTGNVIKLSFVVPKCRPSPSAPQLLCLLLLQRAPEPAQHPLYRTGIRDKPRRLCIQRRRLGA